VKLPLSNVAKFSLFNVFLYEPILIWLLLLFKSIYELEILSSFISKGLLGSAKFSSPPHILFYL